MRKYFNVFEAWEDPIDAKPMKPTVEWMSSRFDSLNSRFFNGKLPKPNFKVAVLGGHTLGQLSFGIGFRYNRDTRMPTDGIQDLMEYDPTITMNGGIARTEHHLENTLLHEMIHWWVDWHYVGIGYGFPKKGHGTEFKEVCDRINRESGGEFNIQTITDTSKENLTMDDALMDASERARARVHNQKCGIVWVKYQNGIEGFVLTDLKKLDDILLEIKDLNTYGIASGRTHDPYTRWIRYSDDPEICGIIQHLNDPKFSICRKYTGYYNIAKYPKVKEFFDRYGSSFHNYSLD